MYVSLSLINGTGPFFQLFRNLFMHILEECRKKGKPNMHRCAPNATSV